MMGQSNKKASRIILAVESRLLREMLRHAIDKSPHLQVVGEAKDGSDLVTLVEQRDAEWVVTSLQPDGCLSRTTIELLNVEPSVSVLAVASDGSEVRLGWSDPKREVIAEGSNGKSVELKWTQPNQEPLEDLSLDDLIAVLRKGELWELKVHAQNNSDS